MRTVFVVFFISLMAGLFALPAQAQQAVAQPNPTCDARDKVLSALSGRYFEQPTSMGLAANGSMVEVLVSEKGTWTIISTMPNGLSCLIAAGEYWEKVPEKLAGMKM